MIGKVVTDNVLGNGIISHNTVGGEVASAEDPLLGSFTFTAAAMTFDFGKNVYFGFLESSAVPYGTVTAGQTVTLAGGSVVTFGNSSSNFVNTLGSGLADRSGNAGDEFSLGLLFIGQSVPARTEANYFKTVRIINQTASTTVNVPFSDITWATPVTSGSNGRVGGAKLNLCLLYTSDAADE